MVFLVTEKMWRNEKKLANLNCRIYVGNGMKFMLYTGINCIIFGFDENWILRSSQAHVQILHVFYF